MKLLLALLLWPSLLVAQAQVTCTGSATCSGSITISATGGSTAGSPNMNVAYLAPSCNGQANCFVAVGDNATDNSAAFAASSAYANAYAQATINGQKNAPLTVYLSTGEYKYASGLSFTQPVTLKCEPGAILNYTGAAHAVDLGPTALTSTTFQAGIYTVQGCGFTGGASMTEGIYVNPYVTISSIQGNNFTDFGSASGFNVYFAGFNYAMTVTGNNFRSDDGVGRNCVRFDSQNSTNGRMTFSYNVLGNNVAANDLCAAASGIGVWVDGYDSEISHNVFGCGLAPAIRVGYHAPETFIDNNYFEPVLVASGAPPVIQYGDPAGGYNPSGFIDGLRVENNAAFMHHSSGGSSYFIGPTTASTGLTNAVVAHNILSDYTNTQEAIVENNLAGQTGNVVSDLMFTTANWGIAPDANVVTVGSNVTPWQNRDLAAISCSAGNHISAINSDGTATCSPDASASGAAISGTPTIGDTAVFGPGVGQIQDGGPPGGGSFVAPGVRATSNVAQSIPDSSQNSVYTTLTFNVNDYDNSSMHSTTVNNTRININTAGVYELCGYVAWANTPGNVFLRFLVTSGGNSVGQWQSGIAYNGGSGWERNTCTMYKFKSGDYVELQVRQNSGSALNSASYSSPEAPLFSAQYLGPG